MLDVKSVLQGLAWMAPEAALTALIMLVILAEVLFRRDKRPVGFLALIGTLAAAYLAIRAWEVWPAAQFCAAAPAGPQAAFGGAIAVDLYGIFFKVLFLLAAAVAIVLTQPVV